MAALTAITAATAAGAPRGDDPRFPHDLRAFANVRTFPGGAEWVARVPLIVSELEQQWGVTAGLPYPGGSMAWVAPAVDVAGRQLVLKVAWPHVEQRTEIVALAAWNGCGAVRLHEVDPHRHALLIEHTLPGTPLRTAALPVEAALEQCGELASAIWIPPAPELRRAHGIIHLSARSAEWLDVMEQRLERAGHEVDPGIASLARELLATLPRATPDDRLLHGDFHPGNIVAAQRSPWLVIDPKPMIGDPASETVVMVFQLGVPVEHHADERGELRARIERFARAAGLPPERMYGWGTARMVEWAAHNLDSGRPQFAARDLQRAVWFAQELIA